MDYFSSIRRFLNFYYRAQTVYQLHSPRLYSLWRSMQNVEAKDSFTRIEEWREHLIESEDVIERVDFGVGSKVGTALTTVGKIARTSLSTQRQCRRLAGLIEFLQPAGMIELGSNLGISTAYMALAAPHAKFVSIEGDPELHQIAKKTLTHCDAEQVVLRLGTFESELSGAIEDIGTVDFAFIDGNHRYEPTLNYFESIKAAASQRALLVFDDIHWSGEMEEAWECIISDASVSASLDFFDMGIVLLSDTFHTAQHLKMVPWGLKPWKTIL